MLLIKSIKYYAKNCSTSLVVYGGLCLLLHLWVLGFITRFLYDITTVSKGLLHNKKQDLNYLFTDTKYILLWANYSVIPDRVLLQLNCSLKCVVTKDRQLLGGDYRNFHAILFPDKYILNNEKERPTLRNASQLFVFTSVEPPTIQPACETYNDEYFNWTFTYRLDSDVPWHYFVVQDVMGKIVAPSVNVKWAKIKKYPLNRRIRKMVQGRTRAAAWIVSNCAAESLRDSYLTRLLEHLFTFDLRIDVYGNCSQRSCGNFYECENMLRKHYYFYMAFENSFADDYVTEKVLHGYNNYVVPIVYGSANYTRFLPPGSYINAMDYHPYNLAGLMYTLIDNPLKYEIYLRWTNFYTFESKPNKYHPLCDLCVALNSGKAKYAPAKKTFRLWWNTLNGMKWCLPSSYWNETAKTNVDASHLSFRNFNYYY